MDVNSTSAVAQQAVAQSTQRTQTEAQTAMLQKSLEIAAQQGSDLARMIQQASGVGRGVDFQA